MSDEYVIEEEEGGDGSGSRAFVILAGILTAVLLLSLLCIAGVLLTRNGTDTDQTAAIQTREAENAIIAVTNTAVALTVEAMETEAAMPTNTPTATPEPPPTETPTPTNTPVVLPVDDDDNGDPDEDEATPDALATAIAEAGEENGDDNGNGNDTAVTPIAQVTPAPDTLPDTGFGTWGIIVIAFLLLGLTAVARRLRGG
jgi:hypothetical protein